MDFQKIYDTVCSPLWASVGSDGSYLTIDTNPFDEEDTGVAYSEAYDAIEVINEELGLPESLMEQMGATTGLMGRQSASYDNVDVSWSYHPDTGLVVTYSKK